MKTVDICSFFVLFLKLFYCAYTIPDPGLGTNRLRRWCNMSWA